MCDFSLAIVLSGCKVQLNLLRTEMCMITSDASLCNSDFVAFLLVSISSEKSHCNHLHLLEDTKWFTVSADHTNLCTSRSHRALVYTDLSPIRAWTIFTPTVLVGYNQSSIPSLKQRTLFGGNECFDHLLVMQLVFFSADSSLYVWEYII